MTAKPRLPVSYWRELTVIAVFSILVLPIVVSLAAMAYAVSPGELTADRTPGPAGQAADERVEGS